MISQEFLDFLREQSEKLDHLDRLAVEWNSGRRLLYWGKRSTKLHTGNFPG